MPADARDIAQFRLRHDFGISFHTLRERLSALCECATDADLGACVEKVVCNGSEGMCVVCQEDFVPGEPAVQLKACEHFFHGECIQGWLLGCKRECPTCKSPLRSERNARTPDPSEGACDGSEGVLPPGTEVVLYGLLNARHHNGRSGVIQEWRESRGRYAVYCPARNGMESEVTLSLKRGNIMDLQVVSEEDSGGAVSVASTSVGVPEFVDSDDDTDLSEAIHTENSDLSEAIRLSVEDHGHRNNGRPMHLRDECEDQAHRNASEMHLCDECGCDEGEVDWSSPDSNFDEEASFMRTPTPVASATAPYDDAREGNWSSPQSRFEEEAHQGHDLMIQREMQVRANKRLCRSPRPR